MKSLADLRYKFSINSFAAPPNRRYGLAKTYVQNDVQCAFCGDRPTRELFRYLRQLHLARNAAERRRIRLGNWALATAIELHRGKLSELRPIVEAYLLTELNHESIAEKLGFPPAVIQWYRDAFFDVRHLLQFPIRILHQVIRVVDESGRTSLDTHKVWKLVGYVLKSAALDQLLGVVQSDRNPEGGAIAWLASQADGIVKLQHLLAVGSLDPLNAKQIAAVLKSGGLGQAKRSSQQEESLNGFEKHIQAMLEDIPWSVGVDGERQFEGTLIGEFDKSGVELRDDELYVLSAGGKVDGLEGLTDFKMPPPNKKKPSLDAFKPTSGLDPFGPQQ